MTSPVNLDNIIFVKMKIKINQIITIIDLWALMFKNLVSNKDVSANLLENKIGLRLISRSHSIVREHDDGFL